MKFGGSDWLTNPAKVAQSPGDGIYFCTSVPHEPMEQPVSDSVLDVA